jgi:3-oxoacyl-[acyl-carrier protein] reductase
MELKGRVAIVTGASRGIGRAYALALAREGARVVAAARTAEPPPEEVLAGAPAGRRQVLGALPGTLSETVAEIRAEGGTAVAVRCDVAREDDVRDLIARTLAEFGQIDILVNNAAVYPRFDSLEVPAEDWDFVFRVNVRGYYLTMREALPHMIARRSGSVINLVSYSGSGPSIVHPTGHRGLLVYATSKAAVIRLTTYMAEDMRPHNIAVNGLGPGLVLTEAYRDAAPADYEFAKALPNATEATPEALGPPLVYLARQTAETMTGQIVHTVDFGRTWP